MDCRSGDACRGRTPRRWQSSNSGMTFHPRRSVNRHRNNTSARSARWCTGSWMDVWSRSSGSRGGGGAGCRAADRAGSGTALGRRGRVRHHAEMPSRSDTCLSPVQGTGDGRAGVGAAFPTATGCGHHRPGEEFRIGETLRVERVMMNPPRRFGELVGAAPAMQRLFDGLRRVAVTTGAPRRAVGDGKESVARAVPCRSPGRSSARGC